MDKPTSNTRHQLAQLDDDQVILVDELAQLLGTTRAQIYKLSSHQPLNLPPRLRLFGRKLAWRLGTCRAWICAHDGSLSTECGQKAHSADSPL